MTDHHIELESKLAMLERTVEMLSGELIAQQRRLDVLQARLDAMVAQQKQQRAAEPMEPHDTRPPHWGG